MALPKLKRLTELAELNNKAQRYRRKASECEKLAHNLSNPANKSLYIDLAHQWRELARQVEMLDRESREERE
jgi:hypothetical protein